MENKLSYIMSHVLPGSISILNLKGQNVQNWYNAGTTQHLGGNGKFYIQFVNLSLLLQADSHRPSPSIRDEGPIKKRFALSAPLRRQTPLLPSSSGIRNGRVGLRGRLSEDGDGDDAAAHTLRGKLHCSFRTRRPLGPTKRRVSIHFHKFAGM